MFGLFSKTRIKTLCAFCKSDRTINRKKSLSFLDYLMAIICAMIVMATFFRDFDPRAFVFLVAFIAIGETFVQVRWRMGMVCPHCGFDPIVYLKSPEKAAARVILKLEQRRNNPGMLLARKLDIPVRRVKAKKKEANLEL